MLKCMDIFFNLNAFLIIVLLNNVHSELSAACPQPFQVIQRDDESSGTIPVIVKAGSSDRLTAALTKAANDSILQTIDLTHGISGTFKGNFTEIPVGGYYNIEVRNTTSGETDKIDSVCVGVLFLAAGQSNSNNRAGETLDTAQRPGFASGFRDYYYNRWIRLKTRPENDKDCVGGPWVFFTKVLNDSFPHLPVGIISTGQGGTSINSWLPAAVSNCYSDMIFKIDKSQSSKFEAIVWVQGESDSEMGIEEYNTKCMRMVKSIRDTLKQPDLPFFYSQIGIDCASPHIREAQRRFLTLDSNSYLVGTAVDFARGCHYPEFGYKILGARFACMMLKEVFKRPLNAGPPMPVEVAWEGSGRNKIRVRYSIPSGTGLQTGDNVSDYKGYTARTQDEFDKMIWDAGIKVNSAYVDEHDSSCIILETRTFDLEDSVYVGYGDASEYVHKIRDQSTMAGGPNAALCFQNWMVGASEPVQTREAIAMPSSNNDLFYIFPNPFADNVSLSLTGKMIPGKAYKVSVYNTRGKLVWTQSSANKTISHLWDGKNNLGKTAGPGIYLFQITSGTKTFLNQKIIKIR
ncbi:MAG: sialate O-acetylesterase [bacterium]